MKHVILSLISGVLAGIKCLWWPEERRECSFDSGLYRNKEWIT